jgi:hypothetical protein
MILLMNFIDQWQSVSFLILDRDDWHHAVENYKWSNLISRIDMLQCSFIDDNDLILSHRNQQSSSRCHVLVQLTIIDVSCMRHVLCSLLVVEWHSFFFLPFYLPQDSNRSSSIRSVLLFVSILIEICTLRVGVIFFSHNLLSCLTSMNTFIDTYIYIPSRVWHTRWWLKHNIDVNHFCDESVVDVCWQVSSLSLSHTHTHVFSLVVFFFVDYRLWTNLDFTCRRMIDKSHVKHAQQNIDLNNCQVSCNACTHTLNY